MLESACVLINHNIRIYMGTGKEGLHVNLIVSLLHGEWSVDGF